MSLRTKIEFTPDNIALVKCYGYESGYQDGEPIQCANCDRWIHPSRMMWKGGGGEEPEWDHYCMTCSVEDCKSWESFDWEDYEKFSIEAAKETKCTPK